MLQIASMAMSAASVQVSNDSLSGWWAQRKTMTVTSSSDPTASTVGPMPTKRRIAGALPNRWRNLARASFESDGVLMADFPMNSQMNSWPSG